MYAPEAVAEIKMHVLTQVACGRSVRRILEEDDGMPAPSNFWRWSFEDEDFQSKLARAREHGIETLLDTTLDIADNQEPGLKIKTDAEGKVETVEEDMIAHRRLKIDTRIKLAQMLKPKTYGPKVDITSGGEKLEPTQVNDNRLQALVNLAANRKQQALPAPKEDDDVDPFA